jgi:hypothetical protein
MPRLILLLALLLPPACFAEILHIPIGQQGAGSLSLPQLGESQRSVLERFGLAGITVSSRSILNTNT